ncbi:MAG: nickel-dependent lactate racemase [Planctomycetales bacterium]|nr:nickel-dependent lactate racemase [Planctomycetales bacterium]
MQFHLEYDRHGLSVELPEDRVVATLQYGDVEPLSDSARSLLQVLEHPTGTAPLAELARGRRDACILICDVTRPVPNEQLLAPVLDTLQQSGIPREQILILVATGLHRPNHADELREMVGERIFREYRIENHFGERLEDHVHLGVSPRGVPIWIDRRYVEADLKIATGLIEPHFMAGFSGGRKLICPGIASLETIKVWHGPAFLEHPCATSGVLADNPVHEENTWIARRAGCDMIVNVVIDAQRQPLRWVAGDLEAAFEEGVEFVRGVVGDSIESPVDIVVTCGAGYPLDTTFYQAVKGMVGAMPLVKPGGTIIIAAGMAEGIGSEPFQRLFRENDSLDQFMQRLLHEDYFVMDQWQLEELAKVCRRARVQVVTDGLPASVIESLFVESAPSVEQAVAAALQRHGPEATIAVIPKGPYVLASCDATKETP